MKSPHTVAISPAWRTAIDAWLARKRIAGHSERSIYQRRHQLERFARHAGADPWQVSEDDIVTFLASFPHWSAATRQSELAALRMFYQHARKRGQVGQDPTLDLPTPKTRHYAPRPMPDDVFKRAMDQADDRQRLFLLLGAHAGLRAHEIAKLQWADIDETSIHVVGKGGRRRRVPLDPTLAGALAAEHARRHAGEAGTGFRYGHATFVVGSEFVFPGRDGGHMHGMSVQRSLAKLVPAPWGMHTLRHRFATRAYRGTRDLLALQQLLGHASVKTTTVYASAGDDALERAVAAASGP